MISMARQTGKIGPDVSCCCLQVILVNYQVSCMQEVIDFDLCSFQESMEDIDERVRDRVSDEIKKFRENYKVRGGDHLINRRYWI